MIFLYFVLDTFVSTINTPHTLLLFMREQMPHKELLLGHQRQHDIHPNENQYFFSVSFLSGDAFHKTDITKFFIVIAQRNHGTSLTVVDPTHSLTVARSFRLGLLPLTPTIWPKNRNSFFRSQFAGFSLGPKTGEVEIPPLASLSAGPSWN